MIGLATVGMLKVVVCCPLPESVTVVGLKVGAAEVTNAGDVVSLGVMVALYPRGLVGVKITWNVAVSPALIVTALGEAVMVKSTTLTAGWETAAPAGKPLALALPDIVIVLFRTGTAGVMSTSTVATAPTASVGMLHEIVEP